MKNKNDSPITSWLSSQWTAAEHEIEDTRVKAKGLHFGGTEQRFHDIALARADVLSRVVGSQLSGVDNLLSKLESLKTSTPSSDNAFDIEKYPEKFHSTIDDLVDEITKKFK